MLARRSCSTSDSRRRRSTHWCSRSSRCTCRSLTCSTKAALALDRFWRNARTHTLHDPLDYKLRAIGRYALEGILPDATIYG